MYSSCNEIPFLLLLSALFLPRGIVWFFSRQQKKKHTQKNEGLVSFRHKLSAQSKLQALKPSFVHTQRQRCASMLWFRYIRWEFDITSPPRNSKIAQIATPGSHNRRPWRPRTRPNLDPSARNLLCIYPEAEIWFYLDSVALYGKTYISPAHPESQKPQNPPWKRAPGSHNRRLRATKWAKSQRPKHWKADWCP